MYRTDFFGLCGRRRGWDVLREQHQNMYIIYSETDDQPRLDTWDKSSGLVYCEDPEELGGEGGGRGDRDGEIHVNPWLIHVSVWQKPLQYCKVISLQLIKISGKKIRQQLTLSLSPCQLTGCPDYLWILWQGMLSILSAFIILNVHVFS